MGHHHRHTPAVIAGHPAAVETQHRPVRSPGDTLPSRNELAKTYVVAPMTVQNALRELRDEGLIVSRQDKDAILFHQDEIKVRMPTLTENDRLNLVPGTPVAEITRTGYGEDGMPL